VSSWYTAALLISARQASARLYTVGGIPISYDVTGRRQDPKNGLGV
jgi:hypothetical protein